MSNKQRFPRPYKRKSYGSYAKCGIFPDCPKKPTRKSSKCRTCPFIK